MLTKIIINAMFIINNKFFFLDISSGQAGQILKMLAQVGGRDTPYFGGGAAH